MLLVTGAPGNIGTPLVELLLGGGEQARVFARDPEKAADLRAKGAEVVAGDFARPETPDAALAGVNRVFPPPPVRNRRSSGGT